MITKQEVFYIGIGLMLAMSVAAKADASDDVAAGGIGGCVTATQYGKVMMQCVDGTVSVMNNDMLYVCRQAMGAIQCTDKYIGKARDPSQETPDTNKSTAHY